MNLLNPKTKAIISYRNAQTEKNNASTAPSTSAPSSNSPLLPKVLRNTPTVGNSEVSPLI